MNSCGSKPQGYRVDGSRMEEARIITLFLSAPSLPFFTLSLSLFLSSPFPLSLPSGSDASPMAKGKGKWARSLPRIRWFWSGERQVIGEYNNTQLCTKNTQGLDIQTCNVSRSLCRLLFGKDLPMITYCDVTEAVTLSDRDRGVMLYLHAS